MFTLGVDFGTNSVRALVVRYSDGAEYGSRVVARIPTLPR
jgi:L-ribulokinase